jgi:hypothetical protein
MPGVAKKNELAHVEILRTDGRREEHDVGKHILLDWCKRMIGAEWIDTVNLRDGRVMLVDDNGYETECVDQGGGHFWMRPVRALKPTNQQATALYHGVCRPGTTHQIVGDVAVAWDADFA